MSYDPHLPRLSEKEEAAFRRQAEEVRKAQDRQRRQVAAFVLGTREG